MLVHPLDITLFKVLCLPRRWWCLGYLGDEVGGGCFSNTIDEDSQQWNLEEDEEGNCKAIENALAITEPGLFLLGGVADPREVGFQLRDCVSRSAGSM